MATHSRERLGSVALMLMTFSAVFAFPSIVNNSIQIGLATIPGYLFGSIFYFLPFILMIAEFASANSENESGVHSWLESVLGPKWAFRRLVVFLCQLVFLLFIATEYIDLWFIRFFRSKRFSRKP